MVILKWKSALTPLPKAGRVGCCCGCCSVVPPTATEHLLKPQGCHFFLLHTDRDFLFFHYRAPYKVNIWQVDNTTLHFKFNRKQLWQCVSHIWAKSNHFFFYHCVSAGVRVSHHWWGGKTGNLKQQPGAWLSCPQHTRLCVFFFFFQNWTNNIREFLFQSRLNIPELRIFISRLPNWSALPDAIYLFLQKIFSQLTKPSFLLTCCCQLWLTLTFGWL